jgi:hypothetical protein
MYRFESDKYQLVCNKTREYFNLKDNADKNNNVNFDWLNCMTECVNRIPFNFASIISTECVTHSSLNFNDPELSDEKI